MPKLSRDFAERSARLLRDTYVPRLEGALAILPAGDLWWRPHEDALAVGVILAHLEGNVRQWVLSGLGGEPDARERGAEFVLHERVTASELMAELRGTVERAAGVVEGLRARDLKRTWSIQGYDVSGLEAVYHVVEHFAWHTGQAVWIAKARAGHGHGLAFYDDARVNAARNG